MKVDPRKREIVLPWPVRLDWVQRWPFCQWGSWRSPSSFLLAPPTFLSPSPGGHWTKHTNISMTWVSDPKLSWTYLYKQNNFLLVVILHLREELWELSADFLSDSPLHEQVLHSLLLQLYLQLFQQCHLPLRNGTQHRNTTIMSFKILKVMFPVILLNIYLEHVLFI